MWQILHASFLKFYKLSNSGFHQIGPQLTKSQPAIQQLIFWPILYISTVWRGWLVSFLSICLTYNGRSFYNDLAWDMARHMWSGYCWKCFLFSWNVVAEACDRQGATAFQRRKKHSSTSLYKIGHNNFIKCKSILKLFSRWKQQWLLSAK